jgi:addiction module RelE/StbE family toxin
VKKIKFTNQWAKDLKNVRSYPGYSEAKFAKYRDMLANGEKLPVNCADHPLAKQSPEKYRGLRDFHLSPNICVLYDRTDDEIIFHRIGKHNILGLTEATDLKMHARF